MFKETADLRYRRVTFIPQLPLSYLPILYLLDRPMCFAFSLLTSGLQPELGTLPQTLPLSLPSPPPAALLTDRKEVLSVPI